MRLIRRGPKTLDVRSLLALALQSDDKLRPCVPCLRTVELSGLCVDLTPELSKALDTRRLHTLILPAVNREPDFLITLEEFWLALTKRGPEAIGLTELRCSRPTPALIQFLSSFSGLETLVFAGNFYPVIPSASAPNSHGVRADRNAELELLGAIFNKVLCAHKHSLKSLVFYRGDTSDEFSCITPEYLEKIAQCTSLSMLHVPIRCPGDDLVCAQAR